MRPEGTKDLAWGVSATPLHDALTHGRMLEARQLLAQGHAPTGDTAELICKQDRLATHALARQTGLATELLPGSVLGPPLLAIEACELADRLSTDLPKDELPPKRERGRL